MVPLERLADSQIPGEILIWLDRGKHDEGFAAFYKEGDLYLAVRKGECPTGGYSVHIGDPKFEAGEAVATVQFQKPNPWDMVTQVLTCPNAVVKIAVGNCPETAVFESAAGKVLARGEVVPLRKG